MNKKFYTLVASLLLAAGSGVYTPVQAAAIDPTLNVVNTLTLTGVEKYDEATKTGGYIVGKSYFLGDHDGTNVLYVEGKTLKYATAVSIVNSQSGADKALWTLMEINAPEGAVAPQYSFVNKATGVVLAMNPSDAVALADKDKGVSELGGSQSQWLQAASYKDPKTTAGSPIYAALEDDKVVAFVVKTDGETVTLAKMDKADLDAEALKVNPFVLATSGNVVTLSPKELNTLLGKAGTDATRNSFFSLGFSPAATVNGERNIWADDLQAVAVKQFELEWGETANKKYDDVKVEAEFASLYPATNKGVNDAFSAHTDKDTQDPRFLANENSFNVSTAQWVALRNREGKYLVVDTAYVTGTAQGNNGRITFTYDDLYNARTETRFRNPKSYLFRIDYNPVTGQTEIKSMAYVNEPEATATEEVAAFIEGKSEAAFYAAYNAQAKKLGSKWTGATKTPVTNKNQVIKAALGAVTEVTLGEKYDPATQPNNLFAISLGNSAAYVPTIKANTAYLLQIVGSATKANIGKYIIDDLTGNRINMEQAKRQNFQHMPAAQWILTSPTLIAGAPVTLTNREFTNNYKTNATLYAVAGTDHAFFMGGDTLAFIPVTDLKDKYLGYKFADAKDLDETLYTFDYLHELTMDRSINTVDNKDSVVWVDADGGKMNFKLVKVGDDAYGTNCGLSSISNLTRRIYKIKVEDASKLQNDNRYLRYDTDKKKYIVSKDADAATKFFLKENNEVDGESTKCYYTLVEPRYAGVITIPATVDLAVGETVPNSTDDKGAEYITVGTNNRSIIFDNDVRGQFLGKKGRVVNAETGLWSDGQVVEIFALASDEAKADLLKKYPASNYDIIYLNDSYAVQAAAADGTKAIIRYKEDAIFAGYYADSKVSVDNNTLNLVHGVIQDSQSQEVANSAFAVVPVDDPLYRRFNTENEGIASDAPDTVRFYRVNATEKEYLYEDANSKYSAGLNFNFLGVEDKGVTGANAAIFVDTAYVRGDISMPQYMLAVRPNIVTGDTVLCDASTHSHATMEEALACPHTKITPSYVDAWYLVNLQDSVNVNEGKEKAKYQWNNNYTRLGFVQARHIGDSLIIKNSVYTGNTAKLNPTDLSDPKTIASKDTIILSKHSYNNAAFSFRLIKNGSNDFLIESASKNGKIAPEAGSWVKIQNGVPVIATYDSYNEAGRDAEIFNVDIADSKPVANEEVTVGEVSVIATTGAVIVKGAAGRKVVISTILGQTLANEVLSSDSETIAVPAGIVVVAIDGADAVKAIVK